MEISELKKQNYISVIKLEMVKEKGFSYEKSLKSSDMIVKFVGDFFSNSTKEILVVLSLDATMKPLAVEKVAVGTLIQCLVGIPEIFRHAIVCCAANIICIHNHPSGNVQPSAEDFYVTEKLQKAGNLLGISLQDHVIVDNDGKNYFSMAKEGCLNNGRQTERWQE